MKKSVIRGAMVFAVSAFLCGTARAEFVRGDINQWTTSHSMSLDSAFGNVYMVTVTATNTAASSGFKFDRLGNWSTNWGFVSGSTNAVKNSSLGFARFDGGSPGNLSLGGHTSGNRYTFRLGDPSYYWDRPYAVMETSGDPVSPTSVSDNSATASTGAVSVAIGLSAAKSAQETVWVRYSSDINFTNSALAAATGSGTNYTATIPAQGAGTRVYYYVLTSTMPSNVLAANFDLCTLRGKTAGATNYAYRAGAMNAWHFPTNAEPSGAFMRNPPTNGASASQAIYFYSGVQTGGVGNAANQSGMQLIHRLVGGSAWVTNTGSFDSSTAFNQYWVAAVAADTYSVTNEVEYYLRVTATDHNTTFIGTTNGGVGNVLSLSESAAQAAPFRFSYGADANLGNAWHLPASAEPPGVTMRNPLNVFTNNDVYIYSGNQFQGSGTTGDQTGGVVFHRLVGGGAWASTNLSFDSQQGNNKYWFSRIPAGTYAATNEVEYYLRVDYADRGTTWVGTTNGGAASTTFSLESAAQASPFAFTYGGAPGSEAGFLWHNSNRVVVGSGAVQFWVKIGYTDGSGSNRWVDNAVLYYTTNGSAVSVLDKGVGSGDTQVAPMSFDHTEEDSSPNGEAMWWRVTVTNLPLTGDIRYKIGAWNGAGLQRFAEYNTEAQDDKEFVFSLHVPGADGLRVNGKNADYSATKFFVDEREGDVETVSVSYTIPGTASVERVEVFSNLDRRDFADVDFNSDSIPDGIKPPDGNSITTNDTGAYYRAYPMTALGGREYAWTGTVSKTGAYRLTARYQVAGNTNWIWYSSEGRRDHAIVVSPKKALTMTLYEVNPLTVKATSNDKNGRSTFADLLTGDPDSFTNFNLGYLDKIQVNSLWFQPIHPSADTTRGDPSGYEPGSPYATRDYFAVAPLLGRDETEAGAMAEFTNFVFQCDTHTGGVGTVNIMLDGVFNHTAWDAVMGQGGVDLGFATNAAQSLPGVRPGWYAHWQDYGEPATFYNGVYDNDIATAPDRGDFGKWDDVAELYFGKYSALVRHNPDNNGDYLNEDDVYDYSGMSADNVALWKYFGYYTEFWLKKTGHPTNNLDAASDDLGIDALRCDFGQGLPPQLWEYIINRTRKMKWNFVFMAETLDGGIPGYRSNRHFDILNENLVFRFTQEKINQSWQLRQALEDRRNAYSGGAILLNLTGHDEVMPDNDPWLVASRYAAVSSVAGLPMVFYGQEWGIQQYNPDDPNNKNDGFLTQHEQNFGKWIPHFKQWNKLTVWEQHPDYSDGLPQWYGRVNWARHNSPALRSPNQYFLSKLGGGEEGSIFAVAKYETPYASPSTSDVVFAFSLFLRHGEAHFSATAVYDLTGAWSLLGLDTGKTYRVRNLASSDASAYLTNGWPRTGQDLYDNGFYVDLGGGAEGPAITADGQVVQYLKIEEAPAAENQAPVIHLPPMQMLALGATTSFVVSVTDADSDPVTTNYVSGPAGATFTNGVFSWTALPVSFVNTTNYAVFSADDQQGASNSVVTNIVQIVVPFDYDGDGLGDDWEITHFADLATDPGDDADADGQSNFDEYIAGTSPTNANSRFRVQALAQGTSVVVPTVSGRFYRIYFADGNYTNGVVWSPFANAGNGIGTWQENSATGGVFTFVDDQGTNTTQSAPAEGRRFYRITVE
ncbi:MAG: hypothetical protein J5I99_00605 [Verrucomicrobia bacterium]|nr:hypothetical protein [Verrucomicrobiota bacterium]